MVDASPDASLALKADLAARHVDGLVALGSPGADAVQCRVACLDVIFVAQVLGGRGGHSERVDGELGHHADVPDRDRAWAAHPVVSGCRLP